MSRSGSINVSMAIMRSTTAITNLLIFICNNNSAVYKLSVDFLTYYNLQQINKVYF